MNEEQYMGGRPTIGEKAVIDAYVRMLDNIDRIRDTLSHGTPEYYCEKSALIADAAAEFAELVVFWTQGNQPEPLRWPLIERAVQCRALWPGHHQRIIKMLHPLPVGREWET